MRLMSRRLQKEETKIDDAGSPIFAAKLFEVLWPAFSALALIAFGYVLETASLQQRFHDNFAAAIGADEFLSGNCSSRVFTCSSHFLPPKESISVEPFYKKNAGMSSVILDLCSLFLNGKIFAL